MRVEWEGSEDYSHSDLLRIQAQLTLALDEAGPPERSALLGPDTWQVVVRVVSHSMRGAIFEALRAVERETRTMVSGVEALSSLEYVRRADAGAR